MGLWHARYLVEHTAIAHHPALGVHVLVTPLPLDEQDLLDLQRQNHLPDQFRGEVLGDTGETN